MILSILSCPNMFSCSSWLPIGDERFLGLMTDNRFSGLNLLNGHMYRSALKLCHENGCYQVIL